MSESIERYNKSINNIMIKAYGKYVDKKIRPTKFNEAGYPYIPAEHILECPEGFDDENSFVIYAIRIYCRKGFWYKGKIEFYCYKVGFTTNIHKRISSLDAVYEARASVLHTNLLFCFLCKINKAGSEARKLETELKNLLSEYRINKFVGDGDKPLNKESFHICADSYIIIENFIKNRHNYWISEKYTINDEESSPEDYNTEFFNKYQLTKITNHPEYDSDMYDYSDDSHFDSEDDSEDSIEDDNNYFPPPNISVSHKRKHNEY